MTRLTAWSGNTVAAVLRFPPFKVIQYFLPTTEPHHRDCKERAKDIIEPRINSIMKSIKGSTGKHCAPWFRQSQAFKNYKSLFAAFWWTQRQRLEAMVDEFGPASLFLTLSQAEYDDNKLRQFLTSLPSQLKGSISSQSNVSPNWLPFRNWKTQYQWTYKPQPNCGIRVLPPPHQTPAQAHCLQLLYFKNPFTFQGIF